MENNFVKPQTITRILRSNSGLLALVMGFFASLPIQVNAENDHPNYRYVESVNEATTNSKPVEKPSDGKGAMPTFAEADVDSNHYITKTELKNFPYLLQVFDKVDAGEDGRLEQHEYQNLKMETKREAEVR
ncbi:hypothetical protein JCM14076_12490 [Methylosoma difficile]